MSESYKYTLVTVNKVIESEFTQNICQARFSPPSPQSSFTPEECDGFADSHIIVVEVAKACKGDR